jgi:hypothetical protein
MTDLGDIGLHVVELRLCPHENVAVCPLYLACHRPEISDMGCDDGELHLGTCAVNRGLNYAEQEAKIRWLHRTVWAEIENHYRKVMRQSARYGNARNLPTATNKD